MKQEISGKPRQIEEPSFTELGKNSLFIEVVVIVLLIIHCFISLQILWRRKIKILTFYNCDFKLYFDISSVSELEMN